MKVNNEFTSSLSLTQKLLFVLCLVPLYEKCAVYIIEALIIFICNTGGFEITRLAGNIYLNLGVDIVVLISCLFLFKEQIINSLKRLKKKSVTELIEIVAQIVVVGIVVIFIMNMVGNIISQLLINKTTSDNQQLAVTFTKHSPILLFIIMVVIGPFGEECFFRVGWYGLIRDYSPLLALIVSSFLFGFQHVQLSVLAGNITEIFSIFSYLLTGAVLCYIYEKTDNVFICYLIHACYNLIGFIMMI